MEQRSREDTEAMWKRYEWLEERVKVLESQLKYQGIDLHQALKDKKILEENIEELREDLGSLRILEAFMRSGVIKDLGLKEDKETQDLLRKFFSINLRRALHRPETLILSDPTTATKRPTVATEEPENERRPRAA